MDAMYATLVEIRGDMRRKYKKCNTWQWWLLCAIIDKHLNTKCALAWSLKVVQQLANKPTNYI